MIYTGQEFRAFSVPIPGKNEEAMIRIAIIGAGLAGRLLALNLLRYASSNVIVSIRLFDRGDERYMGPAYSDEADYLLLNVPAGRMGAFSGEPEHFLKWVSLRPDTQTIWLGLGEDEKRRFLRHLFRYWEIIRSRIPPESEVVIDAMRTSGQLEILAGRIHNLVETETAIEVHYVPRERTAHQVETAALVINCIGPESDYHRIDHPLVRSLIRRGLIRPGPAHLGIDALPNGAIIGQNGAASETLYTLGSTMKGVLWEVLAVPEIRVQAELLAWLLLNSGGGNAG
jgi:uncharacterized NAD(P)/FAD-binding protein YdhS